MTGDDEQARQDERELLAALGGDARGDADGMTGVPDPGPAYWAAFPSRVRANLAPRAPRAARRNGWLSAPRLALAASLALVVVVAALVTPGETPRDGGGELDDPLLAAFAPVAVDDWASLSALTTAELETMEERLLAAEKPVRGAPSRPTPSPTSTKPHAPVNDVVAPLDDALEGIETLPEDRFEELLKRLDAMKT